MMLKASWPPPGSGSRTFGVFCERFIQGLFTDNKTERELNKGMVSSKRRETNQ